MTKRLNEEEEFAIEIMGAINELFDDESPLKKYDLHEIDLTAFFTGLVIANNLLVNRITGGDQDILDTSSQNVRLFMQYTQKKAKGKGEVK